MKDFANLCEDGFMEHVLCEGCGWIWVDKDGKRIAYEVNEKD